MDDLSAKLKDFNIYDLFKGGQENSNSDAGVLLVQNLERKTIKKFEFMDEKLRKADEESYKLKSEISNIKKIHEETNKIIEDNHKELLSFENDQLKKNENFSDLFSLLDSKIEEMKKDYDEKIAKRISIKQETKEKNPDEENMEHKTDEKKGFHTMSEEEFKIIKDDHKKIHDIDKSLKLFISGAHIDKIKSDVEKLQEEIKIKASSIEIDELKDVICKKRII